MRACSPVVAIADAEERGLANDLGRPDAREQLPLHGLRDHEAEVVREAVVESTAPVAGGLGMADGRGDPDLAIALSSLAHFDRAGRHVVGPQVERAAAREIEAGMVPMAGQDPILDTAAFEREAHVRASVVEREDAPAVVDDEHGRMAPLDEDSALGRQLGEAAGADEPALGIGWTGCIHGSDAGVRGVAKEGRSRHSIPMRASGAAVSVRYG